MVLVLIVLSIFSQQFAFAECKNINLYEISNSPLAKIPIYDQDSAGICYAYTASQLVNYHLIQNNYSKELVIHPTWAAVVDASAKNKVSTYGGSVYTTIENFKSKPYCDYNSVTQAITKIGETANLTEPKVVAFLEKFVKNFEELSRKHIFSPHNQVMIDNTYVKPPASIRNMKEQLDPRAQQLQKIAGFAFEKTQEQMAKVCSPSEFTKLKDTIMQNFKSTVSSLSFSLILKECNPFTLKEKLPEIINVENMNGKVENNETTIENMINDGLSEKRPMGIAYCTGFLKDNKLRFVKNKTEKIRSIQDKCGGHASIVVGSQKVKNSCQYMVKNSWGSFYWAGKNKCYCEHKTTKKKFNNCSKESHPLTDYNVIGCWFDSTDLAANTFDVIGVK